MAHTAIAENNLEGAVWLFGASQARRDSIEMQRWAHQEIEFQSNLALTKKQVQPTTWQAAWDSGYAAALQQGAAFNLEEFIELSKS
jgi:hypothetical protein